MCELALQNVADVVVGRDEPPGSNVHWTLRTLQRLRRRHGRAPLLIIGADSFAQFHRWRCWQRILSLTNVVVAARHGAVRPRSMVRMRCRVVTRSQQLIGNCGRVFFWRSGAPAVSSTNIRQRLKKRQSVTHLLPLSVLTEIQQQELYAG
jgi:nicotinate-nucleotide adenylyltransferase